MLSTRNSLLSTKGGGKQSSLKVHCVVDGARSPRWVLHVPLCAELTSMPRRGLAGPMIKLPATGILIRQSAGYEAPIAGYWAPILGIPC